MSGFNSNAARLDCTLLTRRRLLEWWGIGLIDRKEGRKPGGACLCACLYLYFRYHPSHLPAPDIGACMRLVRQTEVLCPPPPPPHRKHGNITILLHILLL